MQATAMRSTFRAACISEPLPFEGAILPKKPPIDKVAAFAIMALHTEGKTTYLPLWFHDSNEFSSEQIQAWEKKGICVIDLGDRKYHKVAEGSATEWVLNRAHLPRTAGLEELVSIINKNNETGYLKGYPFSIAFLMREMYELEDCGSWWSRVVHAAADVVTAFARVRNGQWAARPATEIDPRIVALSKKFLVSADKPLSIGEYLRNLWALGVSAEDVIEKIAFWENGIRRLEQERARANAMAKTMRREEFSVGGKRGIVLRTSDHFLSKAVLRSGRYAIRIIVGDDGHAAVSTDRLDVGSLYRYLNLREPGRWHLNEQMGALINGGPQYTGVLPTDVPINKLVEMVQYYLAPKKK